MADTVVASTANANMVDRPLVMQALDGDQVLEYSALEFRALVDALYKEEGVLAVGDFQVTQRAAGANFSVDVAGGGAVIQGDSVTGQGKYQIKSNGAVNLTTPGAPGSGTRQHRVIARVRDKFHGGGATTYDWTLEVLEDTGSGTPPLPANAIPLARVNITAGQSNVLDTHILNDRPRATVSGSNTTTLDYVEGILKRSDDTFTLNNGNTDLKLYDIDNQIGAWDTAWNGRGLAHTKAGLYRVTARIYPQPGDNDAFRLVSCYLTFPTMPGGALTRIVGQATSIGFDYAGGSTEVYFPSGTPFACYFNAENNRAAGVLDAGGVTPYFQAVRIGEP